MQVHAAGRGPDGAAAAAPDGCADAMPQRLPNSTLTLTMRASRLQHSSGELYLASSAVVVCELLKQGSVAGLVAAIRNDVLYQMKLVTTAVMSVI
eukprot:gene34408-23046_t